MDKKIIPIGKFTNYEIMPDMYEQLLRMLALLAKLTAKHSGEDTPELWSMIDMTQNIMEQMNENYVRIDLQK